MGGYRLATLCFLLSCGTGFKPPYFRHPSSQLGHALLLSSHAPFLSGHAFSRDFSYNGTRTYNLFRHEAFVRSPKRRGNLQHTEDRSIPPEQHGTEGNITQEQHAKEHNITRRNLAEEHATREQHNTERSATHEQHKPERNMDDTDRSSKSSMTQGRQHGAHNMADIQHHEESSSSMNLHNYDGQQTLGAFDLRAVMSKVKLGHELMVSC